MERTFPATVTMPMHHPFQDAPAATDAPRAAEAVPAPVTAPEPANEPTEGKAGGVDRRALASLLSSLALAALAGCLICAGTWVWASFRPAVVTRQSTMLKYHEEMGLTYTAEVTPGAVYAKSTLTPDDLPRWQTQADPPIYRRALVTRPLQHLTLEFPYTITFDRPVSVSGTAQAATYLVGQRLWQRPEPLVPTQEIGSQGGNQGGNQGGAPDTKLSGSVRVDLDLAALSAELVRGYEEAGLVPSTGELWIDPLVEWKAADGSGAPITGTLAATRQVIYLMGDHVEIEEHAPTVKDQSLSSSQQTPNTLTVAGRTAPLTLLRRVAAVGAVALGLLALAGFWLAQRLAPSSVEGGLGRLAVAVDAAALTLDPSWAVVQVTDPKDLLRLHAVTGRPIVRVEGGTYHLLDGTTCYSYGAPPALRANSHAPAENGRSLLPIEDGKQRWRRLF